MKAILTLKVNSLFNLKCNKGRLSLPIRRAFLIKILNPAQASHTAIVKRVNTKIGGQNTPVLDTRNNMIKLRISRLSKIKRNRFEMRKNFINSRVAVTNKRYIFRTSKQKTSIKKIKIIQKILRRL